MQKWEYYYLQNADVDKLDERMEPLGEDGWELVSVTAAPLPEQNDKTLYTAFMKRPAKD
jgi:hypothetical protein